MANNQKLLEFMESIGMEDIRNEYGEIRRSFHNGYRPSIVDKDDGTLSIACFDILGYIRYDLPEKNNCYICNTEEEAMIVIRRISEIPYSFEGREIVYNGYDEDNYPQ